MTNYSSQHFEPKTLVLNECLFRPSLNPNKRLYSHLGVAVRLLFLTGTRVNLYLGKTCFFFQLLPKKRANHPLKIQEKRVMLFLA